MAYNAQEQTWGRNHGICPSSAAKRNKCDSVNQIGSTEPKRQPWGEETRCRMEGGGEWCECKSYANKGLIVKAQKEPLQLTKKKKKPTRPDLEHEEQDNRTDIQTFLTDKCAMGAGTEVRITSQEKASESGEETHLTREDG